MNFWGHQMSVWLVGEKALTHSRLCWKLKLLFSAIPRQNNLCDFVFLSVIYCLAVPLWSRGSPVESHMVDLLVFVLNIVFPGSLSVREKSTSAAELDHFCSSTVTHFGLYFMSLWLNCSAVEMPTLKFDALLVYGFSCHASRALCLEREIKPPRLF